MKSGIPRALLLAVLSAGAGANSQAADAESDEVRMAPSGEYVLIAVRRAGMVESTANAEPNVADSIGARAKFADDLEWIDGSTCAGWVAKVAKNEFFDLHDSILSDLSIEKLEPPAYDVFAFSQTLDLYCDDNDLVPVANLTVIDDRVLVTASPGGNYYLLLEKPLNRKEVIRLQQQLKDMKFYGGEISGDMDEATRTAVSIYAEYRGAEYQFKNAVITRNLLDGLKVLDE